MTDKFAFLSETTPPAKQPNAPRLKEEPDLPNAFCFEEIAGEGNTVLRLGLIKRDGHRYSYPYSYIGLIEMPSPELLIIHPNCALVGPIQIRGRGLQDIARLLDQHRLVSITEMAHPEFAEGPVAIASIELELRR